MEGESLRKIERGEGGREQEKRERERKRSAATVASSQ